MGLRIQKRLKVVPGITLNLSNRGHSVTLGGKGVSANIKGGKISGTVGVPGYGVYYRTKSVELFKSNPPKSLGFIGCCGVLFLLYLLFLVTFK